MNRQAEAVRLARTYVWWQAAEATLASPHRLLCQILRLGRPEDYVTARDLFGQDAFERALHEARRGEIDAKSAHFWRLRFDSGPDRGLARR
jgi:hypothetical protein